MAENNKVVKKDLTFDDKVIKKIAGMATYDVPGVLALSGGFIGNITDMFRGNEDKTKGINAEVGEKQVALDLNVLCEYGKNVPELFDTVIEKISAAMKTMTGLEVVEVNMHVEDVVGHAEFEKMRAEQMEKQKGNAKDEKEDQNGKNGRVE